MAYKQQKFISQSSGGWEVKDKGFGQIQCVLRSYFLVHRRSCHWVLTPWETQWITGVSLTEARTASGRPLHSRLQRLSVSPLPRPITLGFRFQRYEFWMDTHIQSTATSSFSKSRSLGTAFLASPLLWKPGWLRGPLHQGPQLHCGFYVLSSQPWRYK